MGKLNIDKINSFSPIRADRNQGVNNAGGDIRPRTVRIREFDTDKMDFSSRASEVGKLVEQVKQLPDIRQETISGYRDKIASGGYNPSGEDIAAAILKVEKF